MNQFLLVFILLGAAATAYVLLRGIFTMAGGKDITGEKSNRLMIARVVLQGLTVLLVAILFFVYGGMAGN